MRQVEIKQHSDSGIIELSEGMAAVFVDVLRARGVSIEVLSIAGQEQRLPGGGVNIYQPIVDPGFRQIVYGGLKRRDLSEAIQEAGGLINSLQDRMRPLDKVISEPLSSFTEKHPIHFL